MPKDNFCSLNLTGTTSACPSCSYGPACLFTTTNYGITSLQALACSIDGIPIAVLLLVFLVGSVCNLFAIATFCQASSREMGGGIYRLWVSIVGQLGLMTVIAHLLLERNGSRVVGCYVFEYMRKVFHALYDSLTACTAVERTVVIFQGIAFSKFSSRRVAKLAIPCLVIYHFVSILYEPFYRQIVSSSGRSWCVLKVHGQSLVQYARIQNLLHFLIPYLINLIFPIVWLAALTKHKSTLHRSKSTWFCLQTAVSSYKYTVVASYALVFLNTPRLIVTLWLTCIEVPWQNTAYIAAYFLSLVPWMTNLLLFVLPSPKHRPEFLGLVHRLVTYRYRREYGPA